MNMAASRMIVKPADSASDRAVGSALHAIRGPGQSTNLPTTTAFTVTHRQTAQRVRNVIPRHMFFK